MVLSKPVLNIPAEISEEEENYMRLQLLRGLIEKVLRKEFHKHFDEKPGVLCYQLKGRKKDIDKLLQKRLIGHEQYNLLLPKNGCSVNSEKFDVSLLVTLLRSLCGYGYTKNWKPDVTDKSAKANICHCINVRNKIQHLTPAIILKDMEEIFDVIEQPLLDLGLTKEEFDRIKTMKIVDQQTKTKLNKLEESSKIYQYGCQMPVKNFYSRNEELQELHELMENSFDEKDFTNSKLGVVISGMGGVGKSQLGRQYWKIHQGNFYSDSCIWINGQSKETMENDFQTIGDQCGLRKIKNPDGTFKKLSEVVYWVYSHFAKREDNRLPQKKV